ncbi:hypothetical protein pdam_00000618 [Pocillopora damicornis]|uniref:Fe2OG dioxygenase domain-containing protein n=1 Tax=Pocillopora damicornis TaxID=46731 RepID=A0A3M6TYJ4_POCDA|nr:hypothetical protein pdam_00000618 [Pocillopora damicornis]
MHPVYTQPALEDVSLKMVERTIPVVDFAVMGLNREKPPTLNEESVRVLADQIHKAFSTIGFVYLTNHGISEKEIAEVRQAGDGFFNLSTQVKKPFIRPTDGRNFGWVSLERESLNPSRPGDLKEAFNVCELHDETQDPHWLSQVHGAIGTLDNATALRLLHYPPLPDKYNIKPGQVRCGEHSDYGSITLLFQDEIGGLEVLPVDGKYTPAVPIPKTVLVNIGDLMQRWTADRLISTKHRVLIPEEEVKQRIVRRSLAFFVHPDNEVMIECLDGSNKHPPITSMGYLQQRFAATY